MSRPHKRHHRKLLARLRALFPPAYRRKVRVFRRGWSSEPWEVYVPSRAPEDGAIVVAPLLSYGCERRVQALHEAIAKRKRMLASAHESFVFRAYERLWRADGDLPLPYYSDEPTGGSEYDV